MFQIQLKSEQADKEYPEKFGSDPANDEQVNNELCDKGPCLKLVKKPNLPALFKELMEEKAKFGKSDPMEATFGESKMIPAPSCSLLKSLTGTNINGFYWIKNKCGSKAFKV